jgi:hypothetical protein
VSSNVTVPSLPTWIVALVPIGVCLRTDDGDRAVQAVRLDQPTLRHKTRRSLLQHLRGGLGQVERREVQRDAAIETGDVQQLLEQARHRVDVADRRVPVLAWWQRLQPQAEIGQGRPQLVGGVDGEVALGAGPRLNAVQGLVDGRDEGMHLCRRPFITQTLMAEVLERDPFRLGGRPTQTSEADADGRHGRDDRHHQQQQGGPAHLSQDLGKEGVGQGLHVRPRACHPQPDAGLRCVKLADEQRARTVQPRPARQHGRRSPGSGPTRRGIGGRAIQNATVRVDDRVSIDGPRTGQKTGIGRVQILGGLRRSFEGYGAVGVASDQGDPVLDLRRQPALLDRELIAPELKHQDHSGREQGQGGHGGDDDSKPDVQAIRPAHFETSTSR